MADKHPTIVGTKGYETSCADLGAEQVKRRTSCCSRSKRRLAMAKSDLKARPIYRRKADSIHANLRVVWAAMAVGHGLEQASG